MRAIRIIFERELGQYFASPIAYLIGAAFLLLTGITFNSDLILSIGVKPAEPAAIPNLLSVMLMFFAPLLTMRLLAEENREGTLELLLTAPVSDMSIVVGKFLSVWVYYSLLLLITLLYQVAVMQLGLPDFAHIAAAYFGIWLYGGATLAVGMVFSALTENQVVAAFLSAITLMILYFGASVGQIVASTELSYLIFQLTLRGHFSASFAVGIVRGEDTVYFIGLITIMIFITVRLVESKRWS